MNAVLFIDTDGNFKVENYTTQEEAERVADISSECGLPATVFTTHGFIRDVANGNL